MIELLLLMLLPKVETMYSGVGIKVRFDSIKYFRGEIIDLVKYKKCLGAFSNSLFKIVS